MKPVKLKNCELIVLSNALNYKMKFAAAQKRARFMDVLMPQLKIVNAGINELIEKKTPDEKINDYMGEEVVVDLPTQVVQEMGDTVGLLENTTYEMIHNECVNLEAAIKILKEVVTKKIKK